MLLMNLEQIHEAVGSESVVIKGKETKITEKLALQYTSAKTKAIESVLASYRKNKGIVVKTKVKK